MSARRFSTLAATTAELEKEEEQLKSEFDWILHKEVHQVLHQVQQILLQCAKRFHLKTTASGVLVKPEKFIMSGSGIDANHLKCMVTLLGEVIYEADLSLTLKVGSRTHHYKTKINPQCPWRLSQIQDSGNHLANALTLLEERWLRPTEAPHPPPKTLSSTASEGFASGDEVIRLLDDLIASIHTGQASFMKPKRKTLEELQSNPNILNLEPPLPGEAVVSFYVQSNNLILAAYQLQNGISGSGLSANPLKPQGDVGNILNRYQAECQVTWFHEVLMLFSIALQLCQQLKDKISTLQQCLSEIG